MVSYQTWTSIAFEVARRKGAQFENIDDGATVIEAVVSPVWQDRKEELSTASRSEARSIAEQEISVS